MTDYLRSAELNDRLDHAVARHGAIATRGAWLTPTYDHKSAGWVKVGATTPASPPTRWSVLITGGIHAREMAPPDALLSFVERLLDAYDSGTGLVYPAFTSTDGVVYPEFTVSPGEVQSVVERLNLVVAPLVNADGRDFVLAPLPPTATPDEVIFQRSWRKNRRPRPVGETDPRADGVDLNRNFDIAFDFLKHYNFMLAGVHTSINDLEEDYCGPTAASEPETANLVKLLEDEDISYFLDVHSFSRTVMYSWGIEANQTTDPAMSFLNPTWDHRRDGTKFDTYREYIPPTQEQHAKDIATQMCQDILTRAAGADPVAKKRSTYDPIPSAKLYVTSGAVDDYCFSRWFTAAVHGRPIRPVVALTMEAGGDVRKVPAADNHEGGFWPRYSTQFPKIEREVHAAVWSFLTQVAATPVSGPIAPLLPINGGKPLSGCLVATSLYRNPEHPAVVFLRDVRDRQLPATGAGGRFAARLNARYYEVAPPLADWLARHPAVARVTRVFVFAPFVRALRLVSALTARAPRARSLALSGALAAVANPVLAVTRAVRRSRRRRRVDL